MRRITKVSSVLIALVVLVPTLLVLDVFSSAEATPDAPLLFSDPTIGNVTHIDAADLDNPAGGRTIAYTTGPDDGGRILVRERTANGSMRLQVDAATEGADAPWTITDLAAADDHRTIVAGTWQGNLVVLLAGDDGYDVRLFDTDIAVTAVAVTHDGHHFAAATLAGDVYVFTVDRFLRDGRPVLHDAAERPQREPGTQASGPTQDVLSDLDDPHQDTPADDVLDPFFSTRPIDHLAFAGQAKNHRDQAGLVLAGTTTYGEVLGWDLQRIDVVRGHLGGDVWSHTLAASQCRTVDVVGEPFELPCHRGAAARLVERIDELGNGQANLVMQAVADRLRQETRVDPVLGLLPLDRESRVVQLIGTQGVGDHGKHVLVAALANGAVTTFETLFHDTSSDAPLAMLWTQDLGNGLDHVALSHVHRTAYGRAALLATATSDGDVRTHVVRSGVDRPVLATHTAYSDVVQRRVTALAIAPSDPQDVTLSTPVTALAVSTDDGTLHLVDPRATSDNVASRVWQTPVDTISPIVGLSVTRTGAVAAAGQGIATWAGLLHVRISAPETATKNADWTARAEVDAPDSGVASVHWHIQATRSDVDDLTLEGTEITFAFPTEDVYKITLTATDTHGFEATATTEVDVGGVRPVIRLKAPDTVAKNTTFTFDLDGTHDPDAAPGTLGLTSLTLHPYGDARSIGVPFDTLQADWNYTDGTGQYQIIVRAVDTDGRSTSLTRSIAVTGSGYSVSPDPPDPQGNNRLHRVLVAPDGSLLSYGGSHAPTDPAALDGEAGRYRVRASDGTVIGGFGSPSTSGTGSPVLSAAWSADSQSFVLGTADGALLRAIAEGNDPPARLEAGNSPLLRVFASAHYDRVIGVQGDGSIVRSDRALSDVLGRYTPSEPIRVIDAWADQHADLLVQRTSDDQLLFFDINRLDEGPLDTLALDVPATALAGTPNTDSSGRAWLYVGHSDGSISTVKLQANDLQLLGNVDYDRGRRVHTIDVSPIETGGHHRLVAATRSTNGLCASRSDVSCGHIVSADTRGPKDGVLLQPARKAELAWIPDSLAASDDGRQVLVLSKGSTRSLHRYDSTWTTGPVQRIGDLPSPPRDLALDAEGRGAVLMQDGRVALVFAAPRAALQVGPHDSDGAPQWGKRVPIDTPTTFDARNSTALDGRIIHYAWDLGDGTTARGPTFEHVFETTGTRQVVLTVTARITEPVETTITDHIVHRLDVWDPPPVAILEATPWNEELDAVHIISGETVTFDARRSHDVGGRILTYNFNFGDTQGTTSSHAVRTHLYGKPGTYLADVRVHDDDGFATKSNTLRVIVDNRAPTAAFTWSQADSNETRDQVKAHVPFLLDAGSSSDPDGQVVDHVWTIDGREVPGAKTLELRFDNLGPHTIALKVLDDNGAYSEVVSRTLRADDGIRLTQSQDPPSGWQINPTTTVTVKGLVHDLQGWPGEGAPVSDARVTIQVYYDGALGSSPAKTPYETVTKTTDDAGEVHHVVGKNGGPAYQAGRYRVTMTAVYADSHLGDTEYSKTTKTVFVVEP